MIGGEISGGRLGQFVLYAMFAAGAIAELSEVWGELAQAAGAAERLMELLAARPEIRRARAALAIAGAAARHGSPSGRALRLSLAARSVRRSTG